MSTLVPLSTGVSLEVHVSPPPRRDDTIGNKLAVCLHPWSWLGGRMNDPVLHSLLEPLHNGGFHVVRYNSRGVGKSTGWSSFTGQAEATDLTALIEWARSSIGDVRSVLVVGYSYGSLVASLQPVLPDVETAHVLISYPLSVRGWLTMFRSSRYDEALVALAREPRSNVLFIFGDHDNFTAVDKYRSWKETLGERVEWVEVKNGTHFWRDEDGDELATQIGIKCDDFSTCSPSLIMPLPDERPRGSVANLIGRFEQQKKRQSVSPRSSSVASNITGDSAKEEVKEKREWPPRQPSGDSKSPPPIVASSSWTRRASESPAVQQSSSPPISVSTSRISLSPQPIAPPPHIETQPFSSEPSITVDPSSPATPQPATPKPANPKPVAAAKTTKSPAKPTHKPVAATPVKSHSPSPSQVLSPAAAARAKAAASAPKPGRSSMGGPGARAKTPVKSTGSTASTTRPKTPSSLYAPTAATLARARNSQAVPPPAKKLSLTPEAAARLSAPTAASKARIAAAAAASPPTRGKPVTRGVTRGTPKAKTPASTRVKTETTKAAVDAASAGEIPDEEEHHVEEIQDEETHEVETHEQEEVHEEEEVHEQDGAQEDEQVEDQSHEETVEDQEPIEADIAAADIVSDDSHPSDQSATVVDSKDETGNDLEEMVHMLEGKTRPLSIASIPDDLDV
ncbi:Peptidase-S15 domain-containing protein [Mycena indigotica]|uniref:Peptidase-S15 domain-containing protein n=1 Tax=Mycena indigotica TaxID=2126181 RepID=A0A8H6WBW2_9AGAR|nr:Peptidase-S15 domain-containing protein [Mycena indigotica]KAF7312227.1 Peptidase-S15 domain-containing protein [Mycena indigotica]